MEALIMILLATSYRVANKRGQEIGEEFGREGAVALAGQFQRFNENAYFARLRDHLRDCPTAEDIEFAALAADEPAEPARETVPA